MADQPVRFTPLGNLDKDSEYKLIGKGNYTDALDVIKQDDEGQVSGTIQPTKRNKHAFSSGSVEAQNKKYRVTVDGDATKSHALKFLSTKRDYIITTGTGPNGEVEFNGTISSLQSNFNASNLPGAFQVSVSGNTMEFELAPYPYYQWYLESVGTDDVEVVCIQEAIPTDLAGPLKDIGSYDLLGDLFVFSTTQDNEPTELEAEIIGLGPISPNPTPPPNNLLVGPLTSLTFNAPHGLQEGQWIRITDSNAPWLNGTFVVHDVTSTISVEIVTDTAWGASHPTFIVGQEKVFIHPTGIGEIGVAQKNNSTESWTYTRLLRSVELNFVSNYEIDCHSHKDSSGANLYYTDDYNQPRKFKYKGNYVLDGSLNHINSDSIFVYDFIFEQSSLVSSSPSGVFNFEEQLQTGGSLITGNKYYTFRYLFSEGSYSPWSSLSRPVNVYKENINSNPKILSGNNSIETTKANVISISQLSFQIAYRIEVAVIEEIDGVLRGTIIKEIDSSSESVIFTHFGDKDEIISDLDVGEVDIISDSFLPIKAKSIRSIDSRNVLSNIETLNKLDLSEWVRTFRHSIKRKFISESTKFQKGEYQLTENTFNNIGFMLNETYRIGCRAYIKGVGKTDIFWVDDIRVDTNSINESNPFGDNRRNDSIPNYDLCDQLSSAAYNFLESGSLSVPGLNTGSQNDPAFTDQFGVTWDSWENYSNKEFYNNPDGTPKNLSSISRLIVPYINIEDIDYSFFIKDFGFQASEIVDALEFFIGDVPNSVKASGVGIFSVEAPEVQNPPDIIGGSQGGYGGPVDVVNGPVQNSNLWFPYWASGKYLFEYPFATGSDISGYSSGTGLQTAVNYPVKTYPYATKFTERKDVISFYSGDTVFDKGNYSSNSLIVFGAMDLQNNYQDVKIITDYEYATGQSVISGTSNSTLGLANKSKSYWAKFSPRLTSSTYREYTVLSQEYIDTESLNPVERLSYESVNGGPKVSSWFSNNETPTGEELLAQDLDGESFSKRIPVLSRWRIKNLPGEVEWMGGLVGTTLNYQRGPVLKLSSSVDLNDSLISPSFVNNFETLRYSNRGVIYCQMFSDERSRYPEIYDTKYSTLGSMLITNSLASSHELKCGDTFTQTTIIKHRSAGAKQSELNLAAETFDTNIMDPAPVYGINDNKFDLAKEIYETGFGSGIIATCQNRVNANMFTIDESLDSDQVYYPKDLTKYWLSAFQFETLPKYNKSYSLLSKFKLSSYRPPNSIGGGLFDFPNRIMYSLRKDESGIFDEYKSFLPLNIKDLDLSFGEIIHHEDINGELFTIQPRKYQLQYFNTRGTLQGSNEGVEVLIGDGSVLSRDGQTLSSYGTQHKWSVVKGSSPGGKDVIYWFNQENGLFMRFGADGTVVLSERHGMRSFSANNTRWTENQYTPALNYGIRSVWDDRFKEAIWTFIGVRQLSKWEGLVRQLAGSSQYTSITEYIDGQTVTNDTYVNYEFEQIPDVYICIQSHQNTTPGSEPGVGNDWETYWRRVDRDDPEYYSVFTLAFNELSNGFSTFYSHLPKTYLKWKNKFLSSHPTERSEIYEHRYGYDKWYEYEGVWKESEPFLEGVVNPFPDQSKKFVAIQALSDNVPDRIELKTKDHESFLVSTDFDPEDDAWRTPIKNDILTSQTSDPNDDTQSLVGAYMRVKFKFFNGAYNKLNNLVVKVRQRLRRTQS